MCDYDYSEYCPICERYIVPDNMDQFIAGAHDSLIYVHDDVLHEDADIEALRLGIQ